MKNFKIALKLTKGAETIKKEVKIKANAEKTDILMIKYELIDVINDFIRAVEDREFFSYLKEKMGYEWHDPVVEEKIVSEEEEEAIDFANEFLNA